MFEWTIVQEARKRKNSDTNISEDELKSVSKEDTEEAEDEDIEATDYTSDDDGNSETEEVDLDDEGLEASDYTEDVDSDENDESEDNVEEDVDENTDGDDLEATDYSEESDETGTDSEYEEQQSDSEVNDDENQLKNSNLINDYVYLYDSIKSILSKVNSMNKTDLLKNKIIIQVSKNLNILLNTIYKYIINSFDKNTYIFNMYQFNLFIEAVNINIQMLKKSSELVSKK